MATTENNFTGNGTQVSYAFTFPYLETSDVKIGLKLGTGAEQVLAATEYTFPNATTLKLDTISSATTWQETSGAPKSGIKVRVHRKTADDNVASTFYPGSAIRSSDLNDNFLQNLYVTQEARNITSDSTTVAEEAKTNADAAVVTANAADANATTALNNSRESDGSGGYNTAIAIANAANTTANNANTTSANKIAKDGSTTITANIPFNSKKITGLADPTSAQDGATKAYVDAHLLDEDDLATNSATKPPSQQSIKAYIGTTNYTKTEADARFYNLASAEEIQSGETWSAADNLVATTAAIDARITDLVDDVGGFVPIANETSFPNANPDVNNGAGTLISIKALASNLTSNGSGVATIANGNVANSATVTINGLANSTTYAAGFGMIVETTSTLHTYSFHRQTPKATEVTTVATNISNVNTVAGAIANVNLTGGSIANVNTTGGAITNVNNVGGNITSVNTCASNLTSIANYGDQYQVAGSAPVTDGGGNSLAEGDLYFDTSADELKVYNGSAWQGGITDIADLVSKSGSTMTGHLVLDNQKNVRFEEATANGNHYAALQAPASLAANYTLTLPTTDGDADQVLTSNGSGVLSWADASTGATGAGGDEVFIENEQTVTTSYTLTTNKNAQMVGPVAFNSGATVTVPSNAVLVVH